MKFCESDMDVIYIKCVQLMRLAVLEGMNKVQTVVKLKLISEALNTCIYIKYVTECK